MTYTGIECPVCSKKFSDTDDIVVCPICGTPHHRECFAKNGGCANRDRHQEGFIWQMPQNIPHTDGGRDYQGYNAGDFKICPRCGEKNQSFEPVCTRCGERLKGSGRTIQENEPFNTPFGGYGDRPNPNNFSPYQNVFAADARTVYGEDAKIEDIPVTEVAEYVQKDSVKYIGKFLSMEEKKSKISWNWSAGIFSAFWCFYRKLTAAGIALIAIFFSFFMFSATIPAYIYKTQNPAVYEEYQQTVVALTDEMQSVLTEGASADLSAYYSLLRELVASPVSVTSYVMVASLFVLTSVVFGFLGNYFYKRKTVKDIRMCRQFAVDSMSYHMYLRQRGGVSLANILIPVICYMLVNMITTYF